MKKIMTIAVIMALSAVGLRADTSLNLFVGHLRLSNGNLMPSNGLWLVVVDTANNGFSFSSSAVGAPTSLSSFLAGDDLIVGRGNPTEDGALYNEVVVVTYTNGVSQNDPIAFYWFPSLTLASTTVPAGTAWGTYTDPVGIDGSEPWKMPADTGALITLNFLTQSTEVGSNPDSAGYASNQMIPEPSTVLLVGMAMAGFWIIRRRNRK